MVVGPYLSPLNLFIFGSILDDAGTTLGTVLGGYSMVAQVTTWC